MVARRQGISPSDAEIVITYSGLACICPDVR